MQNKEACCRKISYNVSNEFILSYRLTEMDNILYCQFCRVKYKSIC